MGTAAPTTRFMVIDYGMGNLHSMVNAMTFLGADVFISDDRKDLDRADAYILPGVGAFGEAMNSLRRLELIEPLSEQVLAHRKPFLGICLGMQLIAEDSEEIGFHQGLGWLPGHVKRLEPGDGLRLPHVGWNDVTVLRREPLFDRIQGDHNFYFVHSYHVVCDERLVAATCCYGTTVVAALQKDNIFAAQFHPEKSQANGLRLLRNFVDYVERAA